MAKKRKAPLLDFGAILSEPVKVTINGTQRNCTPYEASMEKCLADALAGNTRACIRFIGACLRLGLVDKPQVPDDEHEYAWYIPKDWDQNEWLAKRQKDGPPPWTGERDGLTQEAREQLLRNHHG